jgi:methyl-accepting chemotaxis protein
MTNDGSKPAGEQRPPFRRRKFIVDNALQYRLIGTLLTVWFGNSLFFSVVLYFFYEGHLQRFYLLTPRPGLEPDLSLPMLFVVSMFFFYVFGLIVLGIVGVFMSHQIAGPLYRTKKSMDRVRHGDFAFRLRFRHGDFLGDFADVFNAMLDGLVRQREADIAELRAIEKATGDPILLKRLVGALTERKQAEAGLLTEDGSNGAARPESAIVAISRQLSQS